MSNNLQGILWGLVAAALFAIVAAMAKIAVDEYHVLQILFFRQLVVFMTSVPNIVKEFPQSLVTNQPKLHVARLLGSFVALACSIWAVALLPLTTAITLSFSQVFFITLLAMSFLHETVGKHRIGAVIVGFIGVVVAMRPGVDGLLNVHALVPVLGALGAAVAIISVRRLSQKESTATLLVYQATFVGILSGVPLLWLWKTPDLSGLLFLLSMGTFAAAGQWIGVKALRLGEASIISNVQYMQLVYGVILGYLLFSEWPDGYTLLGAAIIIASSLYIFRRETKTKYVLANEDTLTGH